MSTGDLDTVDPKRIAEKAGTVRCERTAANIG
jgi:hypothetical protein